MFNFHEKDKSNDFWEVIQQVVELILKILKMVWKSVLKKLPVDDLDHHLVTVALFISPSIS